MNERSRIAAELQDLLNWPTKFSPEYPGSTFSEIEVYSDFSWLGKFNHNKHVFSNYVSLARYIRRRGNAKRRLVLILTDREGAAEGRHPFPLGERDIFIVNIDRYRAVAEKDAAAAYFAGLAGTPTIGTVSQHLSAEAVISWIHAHPDDWRAALASYKERINISPVLAEIGRRVAAADPEAERGVLELLGAEDFPENVLRVVALKRRKRGVAEFERELQRNEWSEKRWQTFFEREDWIFGQCLLPKALRPLQREALTGAKDLANSGGEVVDYTYVTVSAGSFITFVEIKTPDAELVRSGAYRGAAHAIHRDLAGAVAQIQSQLYSWDSIGSAVRRNIEKALKEGWSTANTLGILVLGKSTSLTTDEMKLSFELCKSHLHGVEIVTFDEVLARAQAIANPRDDGDSAERDRR